MNDSNSLGVMQVTDQEPNSLGLLRIKPATTNAFKCGRNFMYAVYTFAAPLITQKHPTFDGDLHSRYIDLTDGIAVRFDFEVPIKQKLGGKKTVMRHHYLVVEFHEDNKGAIFITTGTKANRELIGAGIEHQFSNKMLRSMSTKVKEVIDKNEGFDKFEVAGEAILNHFGDDPKKMYRSMKITTQFSPAMIGD